MKRPILQAPDPRLHIVARPVATYVEGGFNYVCDQVVSDLCDTFASTPNCIGLAATQIDMHWRMIVVDATPRRTETIVMVNPQVYKMSSNLQAVRDGCMSVGHGKRFVVTKRPKQLSVQWTDPYTWETKRQKFNGLWAAAIHHEVDHLDGVLFTDRIIAAGLDRRAVAN